MKPTWMSLAFTLFVILGCKEAAPAGPPVSGVIQKARVLTFTDLSPAQQAKMAATFTYSRTGGWMSSDRASMPTASGFFVRAEVNATALAHWTFLYDCGGSTYVRACSGSQLTSKMAAALGSPSALYGKYRNSWVFLANGRALPATTKFEGYEIVNIQRRQEGGNVIDDVTIGPIPEKPSLMVIQLQNNMAEDKRTIESPSLELGGPTRE